MPPDNDWKRGMQRLKPGVYVDAKHALHIDPAELLASNGYAVTPENEAMVREALPELLRELGINPTVEDL